MTGYANHAARAIRRLLSTPGWDRIAALHPELDRETVSQIVDAAAGFAEGVLAPLNRVADREGCRIEDGRVVTPGAFKAAWRQLAGDGWIAMDLPDSHGGQGLPIALHTACQVLMDRACPAIMMAAGANRCAVRLLDAVADPDIAATWIPRLAAGDWTATICISEPDAGSDVGRTRTRAVRAGGGWQVTGEKIWISFGDHDTADRIGHCLLARTSDAPGTRGLSLFLVASRRGDGTPNFVAVTRIEEKLGLHGSPTCALQFDGAEAVLLGEEGRGLAQLFAMIAPMRLLVGGQGLGIASAARDLAHDYAADRRQGGAPDDPPVPTRDHADVRRQLIAMDCEVAILEAAIFELAVTMDLAEIELDPAKRDEHRAVATWMLPLIKTFGAEAGFATASAAIQVLGGAGYTREWPAEQYLRDARVLAIYEGTTGMQALDFLKRRLWADEGTGLAIVLARMRSETAGNGEAADIVERFAALANDMLAMRDTPRHGEFAADAFLRAGWACVSAWMAARLVSSDDGQNRALGAHALAGLAERFEVLASSCRCGPAGIDRYFELLA